MELINKALNTLAVNINKYLSAEEILCLDSIREGRQFKKLITNVSHDMRTQLTAIKAIKSLWERTNCLMNSERNYKWHRNTLVSFAPKGNTTYIYPLR